MPWYTRSHLECITWRYPVGNAVRFEIPWTMIEYKLLRAVDKGQAALDVRVLKDSDPYVPADTYNLRNSGILGTTPGGGEVIWNAPYASVQYWSLPNKRKDRHPMAVMRWFEAAKSVHKGEWLRMMGKRVGAWR